MDKELLVIGPLTFSAKLFFNTHERVRQKMRDILAGSKKPLYLDNEAKKILAMARRNFNEAGFGNDHFFQQGTSLIWFTWTSDSINRTLIATLKAEANITANNEGVALILERTDKGQLVEILSKLVNRMPPIDVLADKFPIKGVEKYDTYLSNELQNRAFGHNYLNPDGAKLKIEEIFSFLCKDQKHS